MMERMLLEMKRQNKHVPNHLEYIASATFTVILWSAVLMLRSVKFLYLKPIMPKEKMLKKNRKSLLRRKNQILTSSQRKRRRVSDFFASVQVLIFYLIIHSPCESIKQERVETS